MEAATLSGAARTPVAEYEERPARVALNRVRGMPFDWSLNPYSGCVHRCTFCYVRSFEQRADRPSGNRYGRQVRVKTNVVTLLAAELARPSWQRGTVALGAATDPYQPIEGRYRLTRGCIEALGRSRTPFSLITRGPLVLRDVDVLAEASRRADVVVNISIPTLDPEVVARTEPGTAPPHQRLRALRRLVEAGVRAGVGMAPILPGISDSPEQLAAVVRAARDAGATHIWSGTLRLMPGTREHFLTALEQDWPELLPRYREWYARGAGLAPEPAELIGTRLAAARRAAPISDTRVLRLAPEPPPRQLLLVL